MLTIEFIVGFIVKIILFCDYFSMHLAIWSSIYFVYTVCDDLINYDDTDDESDSESD